MVKIFLMIWIFSVFYSILPSSNPLSIIFSVILISSLLFLLFSFKGGSTMGFLWVLVYMGGMLIVFLYLIFLTLSTKEGSIEEEEKSKIEEKFYFLEFILLIFSVAFMKNFISSNWNFWPSLSSSSSEHQEFYSLILSTSSFPLFSFFLMIISLSLFLYLGILNKKMAQAKACFFFHFNMNKYVKFPILKFQKKVKNMYVYNFIFLKKSWL